MNEPDFEILHFSYRYRISSESGYSWYILNLVFRAHEEIFKNQCLKEASEWVKTEITTDIKKANTYLDNITINFDNDNCDDNDKSLKLVTIGNKSPYKREEVFISGYEHHITPLLQYNEKFNVFQYKEYIQVNEATKGIISYIDSIKNGPLNSRFLDSCQFLCSIKALDLFWD